MKIGLDATPLAEDGGGVSRYTAELSVALARCYPEDEFRLFSDQPFSAPPGAPANLTAAPAAFGILERRWWLAGLPRRLRQERIGVFHGCDFAVPYLPLQPSVLTLHDLSPWLSEHSPPGSARVARRTPFLLGLGLATMAVTPSEAVRREAIEFFGLHPGRVAAIPLAASEQFRPRSRPRGGRPYFLFVGNLDRRKNVEVLLEAWRGTARPPDAELLIAGRPRDGTPGFPPLPGVRLLGAVPDAVLAELYAGCTAFLFPSRYEGFGLPVLEAMRCGAAVLISRDPALMETAGQAGVRLDAGDAKDWAGAMSAALERPDWVEQLRQASLRRAAEFSWERTARLTREVYDEAAARF